MAHTSWIQWTNFSKRNRTKRYRFCFVCVLRSVRLATILILSAIFIFFYVFFAIVAVPFIAFACALWTSPTEPKLLLIQNIVRSPHPFKYPVRFISVTFYLKIYVFNCFSFIRCYHYYGVLSVTNVTLCEFFKGFVSIVLLWM